MLILVCRFPVSVLACFSCTYAAFHLVHVFTLKLFSQEITVERLGMASVSRLNQFEGLGLLRPLSVA